MDQRLGSSSQDALAQPVPGGRSLTTEERRTVDLSSRIPGWGSDLDPQVRPGVPRDKEPTLGREFLYPPIEEQIPSIKIHKSTEHGRLPPVFGTSCPPSGLSGRIRDVAYHYSEGRLARWVTLVIADRVNVLEDLLTDVAQLRIPNIPKEIGLKSQLRYDPGAVAREVAVVGLCIGALIAYSQVRRSTRR
jgi:hypothetical protein